MTSIDAPTPLGHEAVESIAKVDALDQPARFIAEKVRAVVPSGPVKDTLKGAWLGHALHPVLTDIPIGTWTSALLLDWLGGSGSESAADRLIVLGLVAAPLTFVTGWVEYADAEEASPVVRRIGIVHALANGGGAALMATSLAARRNGARGRGKLLALAAGTLMGTGAFLGGHLSFAQAVGVGPRAPSPT
jgi:uncharacterized membrane protein